MKAISAILLILSFKTYADSAKVLRVFDLRSKELFETQVAKAIHSELDRCKECSFVNLTTYDDKGAAVLPADPIGWGAPEALSKDTAVLLINWNSRMKPELGPWVKYLNAISQAGTLVVFAAGQPGANEATQPLVNTLATQVKSYIIGELGERDRLWNKSFYGPEMLTAIRPPKDMIGTEVAPVIFASRWVRSIGKHSDWPAYLKSKKEASHKIWLELNDCF